MLFSNNQTVKSKKIEIVINFNTADQNDLNLIFPIERV
jgi:hypothetical protein